MPQLIFTENDTNYKGLYNGENAQPYVKDAFHRYIVDDEKDAINPTQNGTKAAAWYAFEEGDGIPAGGCAVVRFKFTRNMNKDPEEDLAPDAEIDEAGLDEEEFDDMIERRRSEADEFYWRISPLPMADDLRNIQRQALSGMLWTKQYYHFIWDQWANGDPAQPPPPPGRKGIRNQQWRHMHLDDILSMPDCWEYPFFAAWDTAFHTIPLAMVDPDFAKKQLDMLTREWYMHPNGQVSFNPILRFYLFFRGAKSGANRSLRTSGILVTSTPQCTPGLSSEHSRWRENYMAAKTLIS